jgi:hypothetical protein
MLEREFHLTPRERTELRELSTPEQKYISGPE